MEGQALSGLVRPCSRVVLRVRTGFMVRDYFTFVRSVGERSMELEPVMEDGGYVRADTRKADILATDGSPICAGAELSAEGPPEARVWAVRLGSGTVPQEQRRSRRFVLDRPCLADGAAAVLADVSINGLAVISTLPHPPGSSIVVSHAGWEQECRAVREARGRSNERLCGCFIDSPGEGYLAFVYSLGDQASRAARIAGAPEPPAERGRPCSM